MVGRVSQLHLYQKIVPNISSNNWLQVWVKLFQDFVLTETKIMIFLNHCHIWFLVPINGIGVCLPKNDSHNDNINWLSL